MDNNRIIILLLLIIIVLLACMLVLMPNFTKTDETSNVSTVNETTVSPDSISVELPEFGTKYTKTVGEYTVKAEKWKGGSVGGFEVSLSKNGQLMNTNSYQSRAYFNNGNGWKWSNWDDGDVSGSTIHKYQVSNGVSIKEVEVKF